MNRNLSVAAFCVGLAAVAWVGFGYIGSNPLALTVTALIGAFYLMGALELHRFQQATAALDQALAAIPEPLPKLADWLGQLHPALRNPVRLRIEGERIGLPGPVMTPYLVGLLVLLGMLGTFLGMVVTLNGAAFALESTTDLQAIRAALTAPVKGLGLAFGTSVAGVAASAMLGLASALCRRERLQAAQLLDTRIATVLRRFSLTHQREETLATLQSQARALPEVVDRLQAMMGQLERQHQALSTQLLAGQDSFHHNAQAVYSNLASSVDRSLQHSLTESARLAGATIQPVVEATMQGLARETTLLHDRTTAAVQLQLAGLSDRFGSTVTTLTEVWTAAVARQERANEGLTQGLHQSLQDFNTGFGQTSASLLAAVGETHSALQGTLSATLSGITHETASLHERLADRVGQQLDGVAARFGQQSAALLATVDQAHGALRADLAAGDQQRQAALTQSLASMVASLQHEWQLAGAQNLHLQAQICQALEQSARDIHAQAEAHGQATLHEMARVMQAAAEAPRAAAEVIGLVRQKLSDSMARDNELLEERGRIMGTLKALLDAVNHAAAQQHGAIDTLVASSAELLDRVGTRFTAQVEAESTKMTAVAAQITGSAVEVSSLGESFAHAVALFGESNDTLIAHLQRLEGALNKSTARSDEQLAYYVAQAREIIDLSILSQKQIVEDLQQLSGRPVPVVSEVA